MSGTAAVIEGRGAMASSHSEPCRPRVWLLTNAPSPYQVELLSAVQATGDMDLVVRFMRTPAGSALDELPREALSYCELKSIVPRRVRDEFRLHPGAVWEAAWGDYDAYVLSGLYTSVTFLTCAFLLSLRGKPWGVWLERPRVAQFQAMGRGGSGGPVRRMLRGVKQSVLRRLLRRAVKVIGIGSAAVRTYQELGASPDKLLMLPYCCDGARFERVDEAAVAEVRRRYQLEGKTVFLFSGQMIERKGVDVVLAAFQKLAAERDDVALLLLGGGPLLETHRSSALNEIRTRVHFTGRLKQQDLPAHFGAADVFVFPSRHDGWGVVVNEACAAGLPVIASRQTGAAHDLVRDGENGFVLDCEDVDGFAERMKVFVEQPVLAREFGQRSRELVRPFSAEAGAQTFVSHVSEMMSAVRA